MRRKFDLKQRTYGVFFRTKFHLYWCIVSPFRGLKFDRVRNSLFYEAYDVLGHHVDGTTCHSKADIVFVVDSSGSINEHDKGNWDRVKNFAKSIVGKLDIGEDRVRVAMVEFGNEAWIQFHLNSHYNIPDITEDIDRSVILAAIFYRATRMHNAVSAMEQCSSVRHIGVLCQNVRRTLTLISVCIETAE